MARRIKKAADQTSILVVCSDLHCGSSVGLMPPDSENLAGNTINFGKNHHQAWLWECWQDALAQVAAIAGRDAYAVLVNGDATEGIHHRSPEVVASLIENHCAMAAEALKPLTSKAAATFVTKGTECHTHDVETYLARLIGAQDDVAREKWLINIHGCAIDATHHIGATSRAYLEASALSITLGNARLNSVRAGHPVAQVYLRGHRHCGGVFSDGSGLIGVTGGWQFLTRHGHKVVPDSVPRPSILILDWRGKPQGALPTPTHIFYNPPAPKVTRI
jgi:hypothetical protein